MALTSSIFDCALVFEGGGMRASYTAAVANMLIENGIFFDHVYGVSAGSSNTINYLSRDTWRTYASFTEFVTDPDFGGVGSFLRHKGIFNAYHIYQEAGRQASSCPSTSRPSQQTRPRQPLPASSATRGAAATGRARTWTRSTT